MAVTPSIKVTMYISGENFDFAEITQMLDIVPTKTRKKEEFPWQSIEAGVACDIWAYAIKKENAITVQSLFDEILSLFEFSLCPI